MEGASYWCHVCSQRVEPIIESDLKCPLCRAGFIEQIDSSTSPTITSDQALSLWAPMLLGMMDDPHLLQQETELDRELQSIIRRRTSIAALLQLLQGASNDFSSLGHRHIGPGLDLLLHNLAQNDPNTHGTLPAQKDAVDALPTIKVEHTQQCSICLDDFRVAHQAKEMPCKHKFHTACIVPWLDLHSSCPVCRFQLPTHPGATSVATTTNNNEN